MPGLGRWLVERGWRMKRLFVGCVLALVAAFVSAVLVAPIGAAPDACVVKNKALKETYASLQEGIDAASAGDELVVRGTCVGTSTIAKDLTIRGQNRHAVLDGGGAGDVLSGQRPFFNALTIENLTIRNGDAGINLDYYANMLVVRKTVIAGNAGRGITGEGLHLYLDGSTVSDNGGDGVSQARGEFYCVDSTIAGNGGWAWYGDAWLEFDSCRVIGNRGGGVSIYDNRLTLNGSTVIADNTGGGGIDASDGGRVTLNDHSLVTGNSALRGGGIFIGSYGSVYLNDESSVRGNIADEDGGGIYATNGAGIVLNDASTVTRNEATNGDGGGVYLDDSTLTLDGGTVTDNTPDDIYPPLP